MISWLPAHDAARPVHIGADSRAGVRQLRPKLDMYEPAVFAIRIQGELDASCSEYFGAQSVSVEMDDAGCQVTHLVSEPVDQAALLGLINRLNALRLPLISVECVDACKGSDRLSGRSADQGEGME